MKKLISIALLILPLAASAQFSNDLYFGLRANGDVVILQNFLKEKGFYTYPLLTGNFFNETANAVKRFQRSQGIAQTGYFGPLSRAAANRLLGDSSNPNTYNVLFPPSSAQSPYAGKISLYVSGYSDDPKYESVTLQNVTSGEKISVTGFSIESTKGGKFVIPKGYNLPGFDTVPSDPILLNSGDRVFISAGRQAGQVDFRTNKCVGYFEESNSYSPSLYGNCPRPNPRQLSQLSDSCIQAIEATQTCRRVSTPAFVDSACSEYISNTLTYAGCVRDYKNDSDFYPGEWRLWMQRGAEFLRNTHDTVTLKDTQGFVVAEYTY